MENHHTQPEYRVTDAEYLRLLGYPRGHEPGERVKELMAGTRAWYARHGRPWVYLREAGWQDTAEALRLDSVEFRSRRLQEHFRRHDVRGAVLVAVSAGGECEEHARRLWTEGKPDEYFFLECLGSAVVEDLVARTSGHICGLAAHRGLMAVPHYSPGYTGWDVAEQPRLFGVITHGLSRPLPGPLEVMSSGMLRPKKSLLAVFGLAPVSTRAAAAAAETPCTACSFSPCGYRRAPYRPAGRAGEPSVPAPAAPPPRGRYTVNARALRKWAAERVRLDFHDDGTVEAVFRFDGTTCSNLGRPLAFDYRVRLSGPAEGYRVLEGRCAPAPGDEGHQFTCAYLGDGVRHLRQIAAEPPLLGRPLGEVLAWSRAPAPAGCHCSADNRAHNWGLALEAIHYALTQAPAPQPVS